MVTLSFDAMLARTLRRAEPYTPPTEARVAPQTVQRVDLGVLHALAPVQGSDAAQLLASRGPAQPASSYDGSQGGVLQLLQRARANDLLKMLGHSEELGASIGHQVSAGDGDWQARMRELTALSSGVGEQLNNRDLVSANYVSSPGSNVERGRELWGDRFHDAAGAQKAGGSAPFSRAVGRALESASRADPNFRARLERQLGGRIMLDGRNDGKISVDRSQPSYSQFPMSEGMAQSPMLSQLYSGMARREGFSNALMNNYVNGDYNSVGNSASQILRDPEMGSMASEMGMAPPLSFEDVLTLLMLKYAKQKEEQILTKSQQLMRGSSPAAGAQGAGGGGAAAAGGAQGAAGTQASGGYNPVDPDQSDATKQSMLQKMMNDLQKVYQLLTNVVKALHDMLMAAVRNIR